jgi:hypothetical protein
MVQLMKLAIALVLHWLEHNELGKMWKDAAMTKYELLSQNLCGGAEEKPETL